MLKSLYKIAPLTIMLSLALTSVLAQTNDRESGIEFFKKGSYKESVAALQKAVKAAPSDAEARTYLGLSQIKLGKLKDAEKTLDKSLELNPNQPNARKGLAYVYLLRDKLKDSVRQIAVLKAAGALDAESYYIFGWANLRLGNSDDALESAEQAVRLEPKMANAYLLKAHAMMNRRGSRQDYAEIAARYGSAADNIGKYILLSVNSSDRPFWRGQEETLRTFAAYYAEKEKNKNAATATDANVTPLKILAKPRASYTDRARQAGVSGIIRLLVAFSETGKVTGVLVLTSLGYGLDEEAVKAARGIQFEPEKRGGTAVMTVKPVEYSFTIY
jgi:TonB family protein